MNNVTNKQIINVIQGTIDEMRHNGEYHSDNVKQNSELVILGLEIALNIIKCLSTKPLIKCKDCKHCKSVSYGFFYCDMQHGALVPINLNDFCDHAERREE